MITHMVTPDSTSSAPNSPYGEDTIKLNSSVISSSSPVRSSANFLQLQQQQLQQFQQFQLLQQQHQQQAQYSPQNNNNHSQFHSNYTQTPIDQLFQFDNNPNDSFNPIRPPLINADRSPYQNLPPTNQQQQQQQSLIPPGPQPPPPQQQQSLIPPGPQPPPPQQQPPQLSSLVIDDQQQNSQVTANFYPDYMNELTPNSQQQQQQAPPPPPLSAISSTNSHSQPPNHPYSVFVNPQAATSLPNLDTHNHSSLQQPSDYYKLSNDSSNPNLLYNLQNHSADFAINEYSNASFESIPEFTQSSIMVNQNISLTQLQLQLQQQQLQLQFHDSIPPLPPTTSHHHLSHPQPTLQQQNPNFTNYPNTPMGEFSTSTSNNTILDEAPPMLRNTKIRSPMMTSTPQHNQTTTNFGLSSSLRNHKITKKSSLSRLNTSSRKNLQASLLHHTLSTPTELDTQESTNSPMEIISPVLRNKSSFANIKLEVTDDIDDLDETQLSDFYQPPPQPNHHGYLPPPPTSATASQATRSYSTTSSTSSHGSHHGLPVMNVFRHNNNNSAISDSISSPTHIIDHDNQLPERKKPASSLKMRKVSNKSTDSEIDPLSDTPNNNNNTNEVPVKKKHTRRRLLPRSKKGCWICRIKHLKCDEVMPCCGGCSKFGLSCDYSPEKPLYVTDKFLRSQKLNEVSLIRKRNQAKLKSTTPAVNSGTSGNGNGPGRKKSKKDLLS
ncbi:UME6 C6 zinc finger URS1-binding protein-like protein [Candida maltosa Xu316]|uniref:UME6 C6 zinc finger URS1-binding protein-like protein n=1 Tax=Candida maltosa (strain Xu316) TaxID=1245528 RepID=M3IGT6_CANMX|nr:UME6 C6 zinc finger URS1-binding protein-like protein [Candida maltosa Xu316]